MKEISHWHDCTPGERVVVAAVTFLIISFGIVVAPDIAHGDSTTAQTEVVPNEAEKLATQEKCTTVSGNVSCRTYVSKSTSGDNWCVVDAHPTSPALCGTGKDKNLCTSWPRCWTTMLDE